MDVVQALNTFIGSLEMETDFISDGYHTFGELYAHRNALFVALCKVIDEHECLLIESAESPIEARSVWKSRRHSDKELAFDGRLFLLGIGYEPGQQITYHLPLSYWEKTGFARELEQAPRWDNHTSTEVLERLEML